MAVYVELFHGRHSPNEELDDWGFKGPVIGPVPFFHMTYGCHVKMGDPDSTNQGIPIHEFTIEQDGLISFGGAWYGDVSVFDRQTLNASPDLKKRWERTKEILSLPVSELPLYIKDEQEWVRLYVEKTLKEEL